VLIVDDVPDNLAVLHDALDAAGYTVLVATDGASALQRAVQADPDIILLDAVMPGIDGFEVARRLKAGPETAHIPIVFMTGLTDTEHVLAAFEAGGVDYVTKPIRPPEVLARMAAHMLAARQARQARNALDAYGHATIAVRMQAGETPRLVWQTPLARRWLPAYFDTRPTTCPPPCWPGWRRPRPAARCVRCPPHAPSTAARGSWWPRCRAARSTTTGSSCCARSATPPRWRPPCLPSA
jgi:CheY-like chemotaxis protein